MTPSDNFVSTEDRLSALCSKLAGSPAVAVDTEFHSERRFWPELFLVQLADSSGAWAVDPAQGLDLSPLAVLMADDSIVKVMHSSRNDIAILRRYLGVEFRNVFDTQLAAAFLGYGEQSSLYNLLTDVCGIRAKKAFCLSDWSRRPLADEQIEYALDDVRHLMPLYARLGAELKRKKRFDWYAGEASSLVEPSSYEVNVAEMYRRARSAGKLKKANLPVLWALVGWRERKAMELDRPRSHIAQDSMLARLAMMSPGSMDSLERLRGMPSGYIAKWGSEVLEVVRQAVANPPSDVPEIPYQRPDGAASARADILRIYLKQKAHSIRIAPSLLLPRETLDRLCSLSRAEAMAFIDGSELAGWRREALSEDLKALLSGRLALVLGSSSSGGLKFVKT
jgi:ribonuclease D